MQPNLVDPDFIKYYEALRNLAPDKVLFDMLDPRDLYRDFLSEKEYLDADKLADRAWEKYGAQEFENSDPNDPWR